MNADAIDAAAILQHNGKPLRHVCKVLLFLGDNEDQQFTAKQVAAAVGLSEEQTKAALYALAKKQKIKKSLSLAANVPGRYSINPTYQNNRPAKTASRTAAAKQASNGAPVGFLRFAKYLDQKLVALDRAISKAGERDRDMLIRIRGEYESLQVRKTG